MGRTVPTKEHVLAGFRSANKFGGLKKGETARLLAIELGKPKEGEPFGPWSEWVHNLQSPEIKDGDRVVRERKWHGNYICLGSDATLLEQGADPEHCPACRYAQQAEDFAAKRRHAMNVMVYTTKPGSHELVNPPSVLCKVWVFPERTFASLTSLYEEYEDLRRFDLLITCEVEVYQNYNIQAGRNAAWLDKKFNPEGQPGLKSLVVETYRENKAEDETLSAMIATKAAPATLEEKCKLLAGDLGVSVLSSSGAASAAVPSGVTAEQLQEMMGSGADPSETDLSPDSNGAESSAGSEPTESVPQDDAPTPEAIDAMLEGL